MAVERIEVFLDQAKEPIQVLRQAPFRIRLDTRTLPDGEHELKVTTHYTNGTSEVKQIPFRVANTPGVMVQGLEAGGEVSGDLEVGLRVADPAVKATPERFPALGAVLTTVLVLGAIWAFFALNRPAGNRVLEEVAGAPAAPHQGTTGGTTIDAALMTQGGQVYTTNCAGCHGPAGGGGVGPALAANAFLKNSEALLGIIKNGRGTMPAIGASFSPEQLAAVSTYVRNSWGNAYGEVSVEDATATQ